jgi:hypothetical protein
VLPNSQCAGGPGGSGSLDTFACDLSTIMKRNSATAATTIGTCEITVMSSFICRGAIAMVIDGREPPDWVYILRNLTESVVLYLFRAHWVITPLTLMEHLTCFTNSGISSGLLCAE